jgi:pimeloyl-ACP methyl ester carboxylesterase
MPRTANDAVEIEYRTDGDSSHPPLLLIGGFTTQLVSWEPTLVAALVDLGLYVIRFDNRDAGLSSGFEGTRVSMSAIVDALKNGRTPDVPYLLSDMAADAMAVLDALGIERAHVAGASMGGMIAQTVAIEHPARTISLISMMSTTGERTVGQATPEANAALLAPPPNERDAVVEHTIATARVYGSKVHFNPEQVRVRVLREFDRAFRPDGAARQLAAIVASGPRADKLVHVGAPTLVMHGLDDVLIVPSGGRRTAELIPGAELFELADWGHDWPLPLVGELAATIAGFVQRH